MHGEIFSGGQDRIKQCKLFLAYSSSVKTRTQNNTLKKIVTKITLRKNKIGGLALSDFKTYYKATVIEKVWQLVRRQMNRKMEENRVQK